MTLYLCRMDVSLPHDLDPAVRADLLRREADYSGAFQRDGRWKELWRVVGAYANYSVLDVRDHAELHEILSGLPLFPYMRISVVPLAPHPNRVPAPPAAPQSTDHTDTSTAGGTP